MGADIRFPNLGIELSNVGTGVNIFGFEIAYYGMIVALGMVVGVLVAEWQAKRTGQDKELYLDFAIYLLVFSVIGSRLYYVLFEWEYYSQNPLQIFNLRGGGMAIFGGVIGGILTAIVYARIKKLSFWLIADTAAAGLVAGQIIGRWANFMNREAFGDYTNGLLAMQLKQSQVSAKNVTQKMLDHLVTLNGENYIQVHPTYLYESLWNILVLVALLIFTKKKKRDGEIFLLYLFGYALGRVWIEGLRTDQLLIWGTNLPVSQVLSGILILLSVILFALRRKVKRV